MKKISSKFLGAIDGAKPYVVKYQGKGSISEVIKGNVSNCWWKTIPLDEVENQDILVIAFIKHINFNYNLMNAISVAYHTQALKSDRKIINGSAHGLLINNILFLKDCYEGEEIDLEIKTNDRIDVERLNQSLVDFDLRCRFDVAHCSYYCDLTEE